MGWVTAATIIGSAVSGGATVHGARKQAQASREALRSEERSTAAAEQLERENAAEDRRRWEIEEAQRAEEFAATEEERLFRRRLDEYNIELAAAREARQAPYRAARRAAMGRLGDVLGLDFDMGDPVAGPVWPGGDGSGAMPTTTAGATAVTPAGMRAPQQPRTLGQVLGMDPGTRTLSRPATDLSYSPVNQVRALRRRSGRGGAY